MGWYLEFMPEVHFHISVWHLSILGPVGKKIINLKWLNYMKTLKNLTEKV